MTDYILWRNGPNKSYPSLLRNRSDARLTDHEAKTKIGAPIEISAEHAELRYIDEIAKIYPCPGSHSAAHIEKAKKLQALADDPGAEPAERALAATRAKEALKRSEEA